MAELLQLTAPIEIQAAGGGGKTPRVSIVAYGGGVMSVPGWGPIVVDLNGLDAASAIPLLVDHDNRLQGVIGHGVPTVDGGRLVVNGTIPPVTEAARQVVELAKSGFPFQASVGVEPTTKEFIKAGASILVNGKNIKTDAAGFTLIRAGKLREVSITPAGADSSTSVSVAASQRKGTRKMTITDPLQDPASPERMKIDAECREMFGMSEEGMTDTEKIYARYKQEAPSIKDAGIRDQAESWMRAALGGRITADDLALKLANCRVRDAELRAAYAAMPTAPPVHGSRRDISSDVVTAAFCIRAGLTEPEKHFTEEVLNAADSPAYRHIGLQQMLVAAAIENGYSARPGEGINGGNIRSVLEHAFPPRPSVRAGFSTHSITTMLTTAGNKLLLDGFGAAPAKWREIAAIKSVSDFKQWTMYRMTADLEYEEVPPAGEIHHGTLGQESYTMQARTYGKMLTLTRQEIINDDLNAFDDLRTRLGIGAALKLSKIVWTAWINNSEFFTTARGNYLDTGDTRLSETGFNAAVKAFRTMQAPDGDFLDLEPALLVVPPDLEGTALKWYNSTEIRDTTSSTLTPVANNFFRRFRPVVVPQLSNTSYTGYSTAAWYLLADPRILATCAVCFLNGQQSPTVESADADFNVLGIMLRGYHDFGMSMTEHRAGVKMAGTSGE